MSDVIVLSDSDEEVYNFQVPNRNRNENYPRDQVPVQYVRGCLQFFRWAIRFSGKAKYGLRLPEFLNQVDILATAERATKEGSSPTGNLTF